MSLGRKAVRAVMAMVVLGGIGGAVGVAGSARADGDGGTETIQVTVPWSGTITATDANGTVLGDDPDLQRGQQVHLAITGFGSGEDLDVTVHSDAQGAAAAHAGDDGTVDYDYTVADTLAFEAHTLTFTGRSSDGVAPFPFTVVAGGSGVEGGSVGSHSGSGTRGELAFTGAGVLGLLDAAALLVAVGALLTVNARRRRYG